MQCFWALGTAHLGTNAYILFLFFLQDISTVYQIFPDEVLGSGQFGIVYGGNVPVYLQRVLWHEPPVSKSSGIYIKSTFIVFQYLHLP